MITGDLDKTSTITITDILHVVNTITITGTTTITGNQRDLCYNLLLL